MILHYQPSLKDITSLINRDRLFKGRWRFSSENLSPMAYRQQVLTKIDPLYQKLLSEIAAAGVWEPIIFLARLPFPENDYPSPLAPFKGYWEEQNFLDLFLLSLGSKFTAFYQKHEQPASFCDYFYLHGLSAELTECMAQMAQNICQSNQNYPESFRYSFGYPLCPDLHGNNYLAHIFETSKYGVTVSDGGLLNPEFSCCGVITSVKLP